MPMGWIGAALLCLCTPWLWFYWGPTPAGVLAAVVCALFCRQPRLLLGLLALLALLLLRLEAERTHGLARAWQHQTVTLALCIGEPARQYEHYQVAIADVVYQPEELSLRQVRVTMPVSQTVHPGDCLTGQWRLRQPVGQLIPGQFNQTRYYFTERVDALASLVELDVVSARPGTADWLFQRVASHFDSDQVRAVWAALALGWSSALPASLAEVFNQAQVRHLLVVSGMHVGMVAAWLWWLVPALHRIGVFRSIPLVWVRSTSVMTGAGAYVALTGFGYPGIRAWIMLAIPLLLQAFGLKLSRHSLMAMAAIALALFQPQAWLAPGAWLSFGLVWILLGQANRWQDQSLRGWQLALYSQLGISLFMVPISILFGFYLHPLGILINLVMIPLVTLVILPWSLFILFAGQWGAVGLYETVIEHGLQVLSWLAGSYIEAPSLNWPLWMLFCSLLLILFSQVLRVEQRWIYGCFAALALALALRSENQPDEFQMTLFDVGHGQAILLQWPGEAWLYDAGARWSDRSVAEQRLQPWFQRHGIELDGLLISHADLDHAGGASWFAQNWPQASRWSGEPDSLAEQTRLNGWQNCHRSTTTPSRRFTLVGIPTSLQRDANDRSCLLWLPTSAGPVMLTGDASRFVEYWLLQEHSARFPLRVHLLGHHGSPSSSAQEFLAASPSALLAVSAADRARPRWPGDKLKAWLSSQDRPLYNTAELGTLQVRINQGEVDLKHWSSHFRLRLLEAESD